MRQGRESRVNVHFMNIMTGVNVPLYMLASDHLYVRQPVATKSI